MSATATPPPVPGPSGEPAPRGGGAEGGPTSGPPRRRITFRAVALETAQHVVELDVPLLRTIVDLTRRPGAVCRAYIEGERARYTNPLKFCFLLGALAVAAGRAFDVFRPEAWTVHLDPSIPEEQRRRAEALLTVAFDAFVSTMHISVFLSLPIFAALLRLLFPRQRLYVAEHLVFGLYTTGWLYLVVVAMLPLQAWWPAVTTWTLLAVNFLYYPWASAGFYDGPRWAAGLKTAAAVTVYTAAYMVLALAGVLAYAVWTLRDQGVSAA